MPNKNLIIFKILIEDLIFKTFQLFNTKYNILDISKRKIQIANKSKQIY